jgi:site-specific recombinase XerC
MLVSEAVTVYVEDRRARGEIGARTARQLGWRLGGLAKTCPHLDVGRLDREHIRVWQATIGGQRPASRRAMLSTVRVFCRWAEEWDLLQGDPCRSAGRVREPRLEPRALSSAQMARLRLVLPDLEARVIVELMAWQGLRCVEVSRLRVEDWDQRAGRIVVRGKGDDERPVAVGDRVARLLAQHVGSRQSGPVIGWQPSRLSRRVGGWMMAAGLKGGPYDGMSAHALRHTAASDLYDACRNPKAVQAFLGHRNVATTDRYLRAGDDRIIRAGLNRAG